MNFKVVQSPLMFSGPTELRRADTSAVLTSMPVGFVDNPLTPELVQWADIIFVMEKTHRTKLTSKFGVYLKNKRVICLDIPDEYQYMDPELVRLLRARVSRFLPSTS